MYILHLNYNGHLNPGIPKPPVAFVISSLVFVFTTIGSAYAVTLKASHQWPGTPRADGSYDPRHEMVQIIKAKIII